jgi:ATP-dependent exoDNAse (exonuclease V) beta subunit
VTIADQHVRDLVAEDGLGRTLFVEAGAGTGKTTQLVDRVTNLVLRERVRLDHIAAITFTEAAASELQDRIRVAFEQRAAKAAEAADHAEQLRCEEAIADSDMAAIATLHGFAKRILGEHALAAGLPPRIDILDEVSSALAREHRWERFVDGLYGDPDNEALLVRAALCKIRLEAHYQGQSTMKDIAAELAQSWDRLDAIAGEDVPPLPPVDFGDFDRAARAVEEMATQCTDPSDLFYGRLCSLLPEITALVDIPDPERKLRALVATKGWGPGQGGKQAAWPDFGAAKETLRALTASCKAVVGTASEAVLSRLLILVSREVREAADARRAEGRLEFHDLLVLCRRLLRDDAGARAALHERYTHLLLDEFQDTDPLQIELAVLIAAAIDDGTTLGGSVEDSALPAWHEAKVDEGRLFFVGDPKQSIYRFRRADIDLFLHARDVFGTEGGWQKLVTNFRSVPEVLTWINDVFDQLMPVEVAGMQPRYEPLVAHRDASPAGDHRPVLVGQAHAGAKAGELRQFEAEDVARVIDAIRARPVEWPVWDRDIDGWRDARLTDVTILVPTRTSLPYLRAALTARDIPYRINTGSLVYDTQEVRDALAALRAVDDPTDTLDLIAALRSPLYACSDVDLWTFKSAGGRWDFRPPVPEGLAADHPVSVAYEHLRSLWEGRWWAGPSTMLDRLLEQRRAFLLAFGEPRPKEVWGRLRFLLDQARAFEEAQGGTLREFLDWAELQRSESSRVHEPMLPELDDRAVRIMTIHGAKGLEFPITILSGMTTKPAGARTGPSLVWEAGRPEVKLRTNVATANHDPRADIEVEMDRYEKLRLLYVACTRARDHLVVACHHKAGDDSFAGIITRLGGTKDAARTLPPGSGETTDMAVQLAWVPPPADDRDAWLRAREEVLAPQRRSRVTSATAIATAVATAEQGERGVAAGGGDTGDRAGSSDTAGTGGTGGGLDEAVESGGVVVMRRRGRAGTAIGRAVHATLQVLDLADPVGIDEQAAQQAYLEGVSPSSATVAALVRSALNSDAVREAAAGVHHKELYVCAPVEARVIEGYVDLLIETPDGLVIVDYKTDTVSSEVAVDEKLALYEIQGAAYALALEAATGMTVRECRFVFCRRSGAIERRVRDLPAAMERVRVELRAATPTATATATPTATPTGVIPTGTGARHPTARTR